MEILENHVILQWLKIRTFFSFIVNMCQWTDNNTVHELTWTYPVVGYPEQIPEDNQPAVVVCRARERVDERLEVTLSGVAPSSAGPKAIHHRPCQKHRPTSRRRYRTGLWSERVSDAYYQSGEGTYIKQPDI